MPGDRHARIRRRWAQWREQVQELEAAGLDPRAARLEVRRARAAAAAARHLGAGHPLGDPRTGEDRRRAERRSTAMTPAELEEWMARNGITGGDRRQGQRRTGDRRRRDNR